MLSKQLWFTSPGNVEIKEQDISGPNENEVLVESIYSAISTGTELLIYRGQFPTDIALDAAIDDLKSQAGSFPIRYGYASVGTIVQVGSKVDASVIGKTVFAFIPHASHFTLPFDQTMVLPEDISPADAVFLANMETAVNLVHDGNPLLGETVVVTGLGIVGLLTTHILSQFPLSELIVIEKIKSRQKLISNLDDCKFYSPTSDDNIETLEKIQSGSSNELEADLVFELTGNPDALNLAVDFCGYNGRIVIGSWYGNKPSKINLGGKFHRNRIEIISSQVSTIAPQLTGRWDKSRRLEFAFKMIRDISPNKFISKFIDFEQAQQAYTLLDKSPEDYSQILLKY